METLPRFSKCLILSYMVSKAIINSGLTAETIPDLLQHVAGEFSSSILTIWGENFITEYMIASATHRHVWHAVLSVDDTRLPLEIDMRNWLTKSRRKDLLREAFGTCPPGMISLLSKLGPCAETPEFYKAVHAALSRGDALTQTLHHTKKIDTRAVLLIAKLPREKLAVNFANFMLRSRIFNVAIEEYLWLAKRITDPKQIESLLNDSSGSRDPVAALRKAISKRPFPAEPWSIPAFVPIKTGDELQDIARELGNCLTDRNYFYNTCINAQAGNSYYYRTKGDDFLLLKFIKFGNLGWYLDECFGRQNRKPTKKEIDQIAEATSHLDDIWLRALSDDML